MCSCYGGHPVFFSPLFDRCTLATWPVLSLSLLTRIPRMWSARRSTSVPVSHGLVLTWMKSPKFLWLSVGYPWSRLPFHSFGAVETPTLEEYVEMIGDFLETSVTFNHRSATLRWLESPVKRPGCECFVCLFVCFFFIPRTPPLPNHKHTTSTNPHTPAHHVTSQTRTPPQKKNSHTRECKHSR